MKPWREYGRYGSVGIELVLSVLIGLYLGSRGDAHFQSSPWLTLLGLVVGMYAGFRALFAAAKHMPNDIKRAEKAARGEDPWGPDAPTSAPQPKKPSVDSEPKR